MSQLTAASPTIDLMRLVRPTVRELTPYRRDPEPEPKPEREIRLDLNESPYGPSPKTRDAIAGFATTHRYPEFDAYTLRAALGEYVGVPADQVVVGAGLDDVLVTLASFLIDPGDRAIISEPTFGVYRPLVTLHGGEVVNVPLRPGFQLDVDGILAEIDERTKLIIICNPNNPTGNLLDPAAIERICSEARCLVAIDEAYAEFAGYSSLPLLERFPHVAILRTMSKFAGLAGMRVGYGIFHPDLTPYVLQVMPAFGNISAASNAAALASLADLPHLRQVVDTLVADRDRLSAALSELPGVEPFPSATNFLLVRLPVPNAAPIIAELKRRGVYVRRVELADCLRVTIGTAEENAIFLAELTSILAGQRESQA